MRRPRPPPALEGLEELQSPEINAVVRLVKVCKGTTRVVRVITNAEVRHTVDSLNLRKLPHMAFYDSIIDFQIELKKSLKGKANPLTQ